jgi:integrase
MVGITGKGNKYRETPIPKELSLVDLTCDVNQRTLGKWAKTTAENYYWRYLAQSNSQKDRDIFYISPHDLRRTWGTLLLQAGVEPAIVMAWGGWESWEVFRQHYLDVADPEWQAKEREKVAWL